jgi:hypothetical protein
MPFFSGKLNWTESNQNYHENISSSGLNQRIVTFQPRIGHDILPLPVDISDISKSFQIYLGLYLNGWLNLIGSNIDW